MNDEDRLRFVDLQAQVARQLGTGAWLTVYERAEANEASHGYFCAIIQPEILDRCLDNTSWDLLIGHGQPGFVGYFEDGNERTEYLRFGDDAGVEPFIFSRNFHGLKPGYLEVSEEFRHFHNLYEDRRSGTFIALNDNGDDVEVVRVTPDKVEVHAKYLKDYLAARGSYLLIFFEFDRWSSRTMEELGLSKEDERTREADFSFKRWIDTWPGSSDSDRQAFARMTGKKVILGSAKYKPSMLGDRENRRHEEFIIGVDEDGDEVHHTCDEEQLSNYFGKNPGAPQYLTTVFFRKTVLSKYYNDPSKYRVEDGVLFCGSYWSLRLDNNHPDYVTVYLGDLGHLSHAEQLYWKSLNVVPDGEMSEVAFRRGMLGEWTDADDPALAFKVAYEQFREDWSSTLGWELYKPLRSDDEHHWQALHVPVSENQKEFDDQVMALSKLLVERLNEKEIIKTIAVEENDKGITKLRSTSGCSSFRKGEISSLSCVTSTACVAGLHT